MAETTEDLAGEILTRFLWGLGTGREVTVKYTFRHAPGAQELAAVEKAISGLLSAILRTYFKIRIPAKAFRLNLAGMTHVEDGDDKSLILRLHFGEMFPWDRPPELIAAAESLFQERVDADQT